MGFDVVRPHIPVAPRIGTIAFTGPRLDVQVLREGVWSQKVNMDPGKHDLRYYLEGFSVSKTFFPGLWTNGVLLQGSIAERGAPVVSPSLKAAGRWAQVSIHVTADSKTQGLCHPHPTKCVVPILHLLLLHVPSVVWDEALAKLQRHKPFPHLRPGELVVFACRLQSCHHHPDSQSLW